MPIQPTPGGWNVETGNHEHQASKFSERRGKLMKAVQLLNESIDDNWIDGIWGAMETRG